MPTTEELLHDMNDPAMVAAALIEIDEDLPLDWLRNRMGRLYERRPTNIQLVWPLVIVSTMAAHGSTRTHFAPPPYVPLPTLSDIASRYPGVTGVISVLHNFHFIQVVHWTDVRDEKGPRIDAAYVFSDYAQASDRALTMRVLIGHRELTRADRSPGRVLHYKVTGVHSHEPSGDGGRR